jgi:hypothetical protein
LADALAIAVIECSTARANYPVECCNFSNEVTIACALRGHEREPQAHLAGSNIDLAGYRFVLLI